MKKHISHISKILKNNNIKDISEIEIIRKKNPKIQSRKFKPWTYALYKKTDTNMKFVVWLEPKELDLLRTLGITEG